MAGETGGQGVLLWAGEGELGKWGGGVSESEELPAEMWLLWGPGRSGESSPWGQVVDQSAALGIPAEELKPE